ncbi:hypothetical protein [Achromobacter sp. MYb9]|uniref:hypothetical protein n=1 Tax=Achromobacter sp. MYb9 TaxID=1827284 RepID=UPI0011B215F2|nr:hypothetical protein [Achromobacter sp. MYb9]
MNMLTWRFNYYLTDWAHYRVSYTARFRPIAAVTKTVAAKSDCAAGQGEDTNPPTKYQLLENGAGLLKEYLAKAGGLYRRAGAGRIEALKWVGISETFSERVIIFNQL